MGQMGLARPGAVVAKRQAPGAALGDRLCYPVEWGQRRRRPATVLPIATPHVHPMQSKVAAKDLRIGMFVADLDRPWIDTPFLLQGFLIEDGQQILQLQQHCEYVIVDRTRSVDNDSQKQQEQALKADPGVAVVRKAPPVVTLGVETVGTPNRSAVAPLPPDAPRPSSRGEATSMRILNIKNRILI